MNIVLASVAAILLSAPAVGARSACAPDAVPVGSLCVDRYEASVWSIPASQSRLIERVRRGKADAIDLQAGGATQLGEIPMGTCAGDEYGAEFPPTGNWTAPVYAASVAGVPPSTCLTWFQAEQACRLAGKRLLTNEEWQAAAAGTPDPGAGDDFTTTCATFSTFAASTGARSACVSRWGAHDMAGNVWEWVAEWINPGVGCTFWDAEHGTDLSCAGAASGSPPSPNALGPVTNELVGFDPNLPGAIIRGGNFATGTRNGVFAFFAGVNPSNISRSTGFRCAR
ncbi:MAG TPA: SUMF1/EgtB/PvdO family nonheme iron enzyme [Candidatus Binatia bacterium]|nr:SUMF1/EgtB/PvdO family nonheme iron enzyme [Candidatus Binatia bacterium]